MGAGYRVAVTDLRVARWRLHVQHLSRQVSADPAEVVRWMGAVQAQDYRAALTTRGWVAYPRRHLGRRGGGAAGPDDCADACLRDGVRELLTDFRGSVALIVGFCFGTDAAVSVVKIWRTESKDAQDVGRLDRDLGVPRPAQSTQT